MTKNINKAANKAKTIVAAAAVLPGANSETIVNTAPAAAAVVDVTKAGKARAIFAEAYPDGKTTTMQRKDILARFVNEAGLTKAGAGTYLQNFKNKAGITQHRAKVEPVAAA